MPEITAVIFMTENIRLWINGLSIIHTQLNSSHNHKRIHLSEMPKDTGSCTGVVRRGKTSIISFEKGYLLIKYQLSGKIILRSDTSPPNTRAIFTLCNGQQLLWIDKINFGYLHWCKTLEELQQHQKNLGPEFWPFHRNGKWWKDICTSKSAIHKVLINQKRVVGIGNIIAIEALHRSYIHPATAADSLSLAQWNTFSFVIRKVVQQSLDYHNNLRERFSKQGIFNGNLSFVSEGNIRAEGYQIYGREYELCLQCKNNNIAKDTLAGRPIYICPSCQPQ